jgi:hypothetical protein
VTKHTIEIIQRRSAGTKPRFTVSMTFVAAAPVMNTSHATRMRMAPPVARLIERAERLPNVLVASPLQTPSDNCVSNWTGRTWRVLVLITGQRTWDQIVYMGGSGEVVTQVWSQPEQRCPKGRPSVNSEALGTLI